MNIEIIKSKYPKAYEQILKWLKHTMGTQALPAGADEFANAMINAALQNVTSSRALYDFFDGYEIFVLIDKRAKHWASNVIGDMHGSRKEMETVAFEAAFGLLEKKLTNG